MQVWRCNYRHCIGLSNYIAITNLWTFSIVISHIAMVLTWQHCSFGRLNVSRGGWDEICFIWLYWTVMLCMLLVAAATIRKFMYSVVVNHEPLPCILSPSVCMCLCVFLCETTAGEKYRESDDECLYLCGHSLGLMPKSVRPYVQEQLDSWATLWVQTTLDL